MADLGKAPKMTPWEKKLDYLRKEMDRTGADFVSKDGVGLSRMPHSFSSPSEDRRGNSQTPEEAVKKTHKETNYDYPERED